MGSCATLRSVDGDRAVLEHIGAKDRYVGTPLVAAHGTQGVSTVNNSASSAAHGFPVPDRGPCHTAGHLTAHNACELRRFTGGSAALVTPRGSGLRRGVVFEPLANGPVTR